MIECWRVSRLGDVCGFEKDQDVHAGLPYVGLENIESSTGRFLGTANAVSVKSATFRFSSAHVLYGRLRPYLNKVLLPDFDGHCSTEIFPIRPGPEVSRQYLFHWLSMDATVRSINATCTGARMPRANMNAVLDFTLPLPPLPEQHRIVAILDEAFEGIATAKANAEKNLRNARELFERYLQAVFTECRPAWSSATVDQHIRFIDYRGRTPEKTSQGLRLITAKNVKKGFIQQEPMEFVAPESYASWMTRGIPKLGDVLFTTEAPLGNVAQLDTEDRVVFAQRVIIMQADPKVLGSTFLKYMLLSAPVQARIDAQATGATAQGIKASLLKRIEIAFPKTLAEQTAITDRLDALSDETERLEGLYAGKLAALDELKKSLLQQAFTGAL